MSAAAESRSTLELTAGKTHVLFMGADLALERNKKAHALEDVTAKTLVLKDDANRIEMPIVRGADLLVTEMLKVTDSTANISKLKVERAYTPGRDPFRKFAESAALAAGQSATVDLARGKALQAQMFGGAAAKDAAQAGIDSANLELSRDVYTLDALSNKLSSEEAMGMFDAIRVSFDVVPAKDLAQPYFAIIAQIRDSENRVGQARKWIYVKSLGALAAGVPRTVQVKEDGMPPGYILESWTVHLYNLGEELATNLSRKRVMLNEDEALQYRVVEYIGANKGRTVPATPLTGKLAREFWRQLAPEQLNGAYFLRVTKDGKVLNASRDAAGKQPLAEAPLNAALKTLRFYPALEAGKPVESTVPVKLGEFSSL